MMQFKSRLQVNAIIESFNNPEIKYEILKSVGNGGFGNVFEVKRLKDSKVFAMKVVSTKGSHHNKPNELIFRAEATRLDLLKWHDHIVKLEDVLRFPELMEAGMMMELAAGGNLDSVSRSLPEDHREALSKLVAYEMIEALHYIHSQEPAIVHRDIKPDNILAFLVGTKQKPHYLFKLADFGISDTVDEDSDEEFPQIPHEPMSGRALLPYRAPETFPRDTGTHTRGFETKADVYSLGVVLSKILVNTILPNSAPSLSGVPPKAHSLITAMLENDPSKRASAQDCKRYQWTRDGAGVTILKVTGALTGDNKLGKSMKRLCIGH